VLILSELPAHIVERVIASALESATGDVHEPTLAGQALCGQDFQPYHEVLGQPRFAVQFPEVPRAIKASEVSAIVGSISTVMTDDPAADVDMCDDFTWESEHVMDEIPNNNTTFNGPAFDPLFSSILDLIAQES